MTITIVESPKNSNMLLFSFYDPKKYQGLKSIENFKHSTGKILFCFSANVQEWIYKFSNGLVLRIEIT